MLDQTFTLLDIPRILTLIFLEGVLSVDNALVIALIAKGLPAERRKKALFVGIASAFILRALGVLSAAFLIRLFIVQLLGGAYLVYLSLKHFIKKRISSETKPKHRGFFRTVLLIEWTDFIFAIDSILAGLALIGITSITPGHFPPNLWIVYVGGVIGIVMMRFAATALMRLIEKRPGLETGAHLLIGWIGLKLMLESLLTHLGVTIPQIPLQIIFWVGIILFAFIGLKKSSDA